MRIQHNIMAMNSYRNYNANANALSSNLEKLSSGYKINRAGDDAAGLAISEKMRAQISGLDQAYNNVKDGVSLVKTAEGALQEVQDMLNRMVTLATQSANGTYEDAVDRENLQAEVDQLLEEIDRISDSANFNGQNLLDGTLDSTKTTEVAADGDTSGVAVVDLKFITDDAAKVTLSTASAGAAASVEYTPATASGAAQSITIKLEAGKEYTATDIQAMLAEAGAEATVVGKGVYTHADATDDWTSIDSNLTNVESADSSDNGESMTLQIGDTSHDYNQLQVAVRTIDAENLGIKDLDISNLESAQKAIGAIKAAINSVSSQRGDLGAIQNRLEHTMNNLSVMEENITDAESTIRDTDIADEMTAYTKNNILLQSAQAMLAQANQVPQGVLQLLQ